MNPAALFSRTPDGFVAGFALLATLSARVLSEWLQVGVLACTIAFLALGCALRWRKLRTGGSAEDEG